MNDFDSIRADIGRTFEAIRANGAAVQRFTEGCNSEFARLWADNAELRDEIHAVANRVESLTRAVMADPAEVAEAIVNDANRSTRRCDGIDHVWHDSRARFGEWCDCGTVRYGEQYLTDDQVAELRAKRQA